MVQTLRPLTVGELLDRTFFYYRGHFVMFVGIAALPSVLVLAYQLAISNFKPAPAHLLPTAIFALAWLLVYVVTNTLAHGATVVAVSQILLERETSVATAFNSIRSRVGELIVLNLNVALRVMLGTVFLIVPGVLLALRYSLAIPVAVLEETAISDSLDRSTMLTEGHRGRILLIYVLLFVLSMIISILWPLLTMLVAVTLSSGIRAAQTSVWTRVMLQFGSFVNQSLIGPIMTIAVTLVYYDERVRKEAFDLEHMMQQLDTTAPHTPPTA